MICPMKMFPILLSWAVACPALLAKPVIDEGTASEWKYWSGESSGPDGWQGAEFDDKAWSAGAAPLGIGEKRLTTELKTEKRGGPPPLAVFRKSFTLPKAESGERHVVSLCFDDGAVIYINGRELRRLNLPEGPLKAETKALRQVTEFAEGFYVRVPVPAEFLKPEGQNVIAVEIRQAQEHGDDLFFDLALRTIAPRGENPKPGAAAQEVINAYYKGQHVPPGLTIPDGYIDGGRNMRFDDSGRAVSNREIIIVDRGRDDELRKHIEFARAGDLKKLPPRERAVRVAKYVDQISTPPGGERWTEPAIAQTTMEFTNQPVLMGEILEQCRAGVCRHRALLFKILGDEAGLKVSLRRGHLHTRRYAGGYPHAWNEVHLDDGTRLLVDTSYRAGKWDFPDVNSAFVVEEYRKLDNSPLYGKDSAAQP
jgi:hypothetical protein